MLNQFHTLGIVGCKAISNKQSMIRYLGHRTSTSKNKEQFTDEKIKAGIRVSNQEKYNEYIKLILGIDPIISDYDNIFKLITDSNLRFEYYVDLLDYLRKNDITLYVFACRNSNFCLRVLRSQEYKNKKVEEFSK